MFKNKGYAFEKNLKDKIVKFFIASCMRTKLNSILIVYVRF